MRGGGQRHALKPASRRAGTTRHAPSGHQHRRAGSARPTMLAERGAFRLEHGAFLLGASSSFARGVNLSTWSVELFARSARLGAWRLVCRGRSAGENPGRPAGCCSGRPLRGRGPAPPVCRAMRQAFLSRGAGGEAAGRCIDLERDRAGGEGVGHGGRATKKPPETGGSSCMEWWSGWGSNPRPSHCERDALPAELPPHGKRRMLAA